MAHKKAAGSTRLGRDSESKRLGVKRYGGTLVAPGEVIVRQRGTKVHPGANVKRGADDTLYAVIAGRIKFQRKLDRRFTGALVSTQFVSVQVNAGDTREVLRPPAGEAGSDSSGVKEARVKAVKKPRKVAV